MRIQSKKIVQETIQKTVNARAFSFIKKVKKEFPECNIYLVGGAVRDIFLNNKTIRDFDFVIQNVPAKKLANTLKTMGTVNFVGKAFGVFKFVPTASKQEYDAFDIALPRTEQSVGKRGIYRDFVITSDPQLPIEEDLARRDFTINALAWDLTNNQLTDPFDGMSDLKNKQIRAVGKAKERFSEDYSRMLRGIRFACQLNFEIEEKTAHAISACSSHINDTKQDGTKERVVPFETIAKELVKGLYASPARALQLFDDAGFIQELIPELLTMKQCPQPQNWHTEGDVWEHTMLCLKNLESPRFLKQFKIKKASALTALATLFHDIGKPYTIKTPEKDGTDRIRFDGHDHIGGDIAQKICSRLKLSSTLHFPISCDDIGWIVKYHLMCLPSEVERMRASTVEKYFMNRNKPSEELLQVIFADSISTIPDTGKPELEHFFLLQKRIATLQKMMDKEKREIKPLLSGNEVMDALSLNASPRIGTILKALREEQLQQRISTKKDAITWIKKKFIRK